MTKKKSAKKTSVTKKKVVARRVSAKKTTRKKNKEGETYNYNTKISVLEKKYGFKSGYPPNTKIGDFFKEKGSDVMARLLMRNS